MIIKKKVKQEENIKKSKQKAQAKSSVEEDKIDIFDIDNIDFTQRQERRRGDRRRGYRRIDDRNLISRAQEEAGTIRLNAQKEGYQEGLEQAKEDIEQLRNAIVSFANSKQEVFEYIAPDILEISVDIARKIVKKEIEQNPQIVLDSILEILKSLSKDETRLNIKVNPEQVDLIKENLPNILSASATEAKIRVLPDDEIEAGSCVIVTNNGIVDATIQTQLEIIKEALKGI